MRLLLNIITLFFFLNSLNAQNADYEIPLSKPSAPGLVKIDVYNAGIRVKAHDYNTVNLRIIDKRGVLTNKKGSPEFHNQILEEDNKILIVNRERSRMKGLFIELELPRNFSVNLETYFGPMIEVEGLQGEVEVKGYWTDVTLQQLTGNVIASTNIGKMKLELDVVNPSNTYFLSCYKKDLEIFLPAQASAYFVMDNNFGRFDSDFKLQLDTKELAKGNYIRRVLNGGGAEMKLINYFGKILIRKKD
ncbi:MAG: hypothetical protein AAFO07_25625 [Bacteroidota bacterium]